MKTPVLAVIGGSGLYDMPGLQNTQEIYPDTPFGKPSAPITIGELGGKTFAFLARHGIGHSLTPGEVPYRANIYAIKALGARHVVSVSACGSLRQDYAPGDIVVPDQLFDITRKRANSFFEGGLVAHIGVAEPFSIELSGLLVKAIESTGATLHNSGTLLTIEGPRFSTKAESNIYRAWGMSIIGMTASPEAFLAREAELSYAVMAHVTDYDVWHVTEEPVSVEMVVRVLNHNTEVARQALLNLIDMLDGAEDWPCHHALADALITRPQAIPPETRRRLSLLIEKYLSPAL